MSVVNIAIRNATQSDAEAMARLALGAATAAHWREQDYARIFDADAVSRTTLVVERNGQILGFVVASCVSPEWELENIVVANEARHCGLGDELMAELLQRAEQANAESIFLEVRDSNHVARALYQKWQFAEVGRRRAYYSAPVEDAVLYRRICRRGCYSPKSL